MADNSTYFIENKALFGPYPTVNDINYLESQGVLYFVDLTEINKLPSYTHLLGQDTKFIKFPIPDMKIPHDYIQFSSFIVYLDNIIKHLKNGQKIYIHCRGGNGRVGIVVACLLVRFHYPKLSALDALQLTSKYHSERKTLKLKWKMVGSPQTPAQKNYVIKMYTPFCFSRETFYGNKYGFVPHAKIPIHLDENNFTFEDSQILFKHLVSKKLYMSDSDVYKCMKYVQSIKITQCPLFMNNLLNTTLRPIIYCNNHDMYWGINKQGDGKNLLGHILMELRDEMLLKLYDG
jgi:protein-tyrosine phosphatase